MLRVIMHIKARWYEVRADAIWRRYLETRDKELRLRAYDMVRKAEAIRKSIGARA